MSKKAILVLLAGLAPAAAGCAGGPGHHGFGTQIPVETVSLYYATDRAADSDVPGAVRYGWQRRYFSDGDPFELGVCRIEISRQRNHDKRGPLPKSGRELVSLASTTVLEPDRFWDRVRERMWYAGENETFVFIHGFNNTFEDAAKRTAEIWYDVGFEGPPIMYSWPSRAGTFWRGVLGYFADSETMKWSAEHLKVFLMDLVEETSADKMVADEPARIHLIAHSMGCRALTRALMLVADELERLDRPIFCDVILAAPDIDKDLFRDVIALKLLRARLAEHYTVYASSSDNVIKTSGKLQVYPRAGNADDGLVAIDHPDFDTVDATAVTSGPLAFNHDYFVREPQLIRDLIQVLRNGNRNPASVARGMQRRDDEAGAPWVIPSEPRAMAQAEE